MNITIKIDAPELAGALESLAQAISGSGLAMLATAPTVNTTNITADTAKVEADEKAAKDADAAKKEAAAKAAELKKQVAAEKAKKAADLAAKKAAEEDAALAAELAGEPDTTEITFEVLRSKLAEHSAKGKEQQLEVKDALSRFGCVKLSEVDAKDYGELLELAGVAL